MTFQDRSFGTTIDDSTIYGRISDGLIKLDSKEAYRGVSIDVSEGRVLLTGQVKDSANAEKAVKTAWATPGVREVINEIQVVPGSHSPLVYANDSIVTAQAKSRLVAERGIASANYHIETVNGIVYVMGVARDESEHKRAMNVISRAVGARKVISHVRVMRNFDETPEVIPASIPPL
jgi:osmotically-inducible protein OsmY